MLSAVFRSVCGAYLEEIVIDRVLWRLKTAKQERNVEAFKKQFFALPIEEREDVWNQIANALSREPLNTEQT